MRALGVAQKVNPSHFESTTDQLYLKKYGVDSLTGKSNEYKVNSHHGPHHAEPRGFVKNVFLVHNELSWKQVSEACRQRGLG